MSDTVKAIVDAVQARVLTISGWRLSRVHPLAFAAATAADTRPIAHLGFAVHAPSSSMRQERQRIAEGALTTTTVTVQFAVRIRPDATSEDVDAAYTHEATMIAAVLALTTSLHIHLESCARAMAGEASYSIHTVTFTVLHLFALT